MIAPGKTTLSAVSYEDTGSKVKKAQRWVVIHRWRRDSDGATFVDHHKYATSDEAQSVVRVLT